MLEVGLTVRSPATSAAASSMFAFAAGAFVVVVPYLFAAGTAALATAVALFAAALVAVGASIGALTGRSAMRSAARQLLVGGLAGLVHPYPTRAQALGRIADRYQRARLGPRARAVLDRWMAWRRR